MSQRAKSLLMGAFFGVVLGAWAMHYWLAAPPPATRAQYPHAAIEMVTRATNMLNTHGDEALAMFDRDARFNRPDSYLFVLAADGTNIYHAADSAQVGEDYSILHDINQRPFGRQLVNDIDPQGVWLAYRWNNPATATPEWKLTFTRQTQKGHIVAAGIHGGPE